jgi:haloalkane dehalogenase
MRPKDFATERKYEQTSFGRIAYVEKGAGPAALFLHGFPLNGFQWRGALERLSAHRRCIAPDLMGLGYSEISPQQSVAPQAQADMLADLLQQLSIPTVDLIANDSGGAVAQLFLLKYPQLVRTLLLTNCDVEPDSPPAALLPVLEMARIGTLADELFVPWVTDKALTRSAQGLGGLTYTHPQLLADETIEYYLRPLVSSPERKAQAHAYARGLDPNPLAGIEPALKRSEVRTRIVWGTGDDIFSQASPDYLHRILPNSAGVRQVPGAKLFFPEEFPDLIAEELRELWQVSAAARNR